MINYKIQPQNFELILQRVGQILTLELENQAAQFYNTYCENVFVYIEANVPNDKVELPLINIITSKGDYANRHAGYVDGTYTYYIDVLSNSKTIGENDGNKLSSLKSQRILGLCRAILEDPIYKTLGFVPGNIGNLRVTGFEMGSMKKVETDALSTSIGRIVLEVKAGETSQLRTGNELQESISQLILAETENGYRYEFIE